MDPRTFLHWASALIGLLLYVPLLLGIWRDQIRQSVATWALWVALDLIAFISILYQHGNYFLLQFYLCGGTVVVISLICKKQTGWSHFESFVLTLVIICLIIWYLSGPKMATISSTVAVCISGFPQIRDSWKEPDRKTAFIYAGYMLVNGLSFLAGKEWTIEERFYFGMMVPLCGAITVAASRKSRPLLP